MRPQPFTVTTIAGLALTAAVWLPPLEAQQSQPSQQQRAQVDQMSSSERLLEDQIYVRLAERAWVGADFNAKVDQGKVTLSGTVPTEATKASILRITRRTPGVFEVRESYG